jgi:hypothetical protein
LAEHPNWIAALQLLMRSPAPIACGAMVVGLRFRQLAGESRQRQFAISMLRTLL